MLHDPKPKMVNMTERHIEWIWRVLPLHDPTQSCVLV